MRRIGLAWIGCVTIASTLLGAEPAQTTVIMPEEVVRIPAVRARDRMFVPVKINGKDAGLFLVDTGAAAVFIGGPTATQLNLPKVGDGRARGFGGTTTTVIHPIDEISVGGASLHTTFLTATKRQLDKETSVAGYSGILGGAFLSRFVFSCGARTSTRWIRTEVPR